jgi:FdhE protein
MTVATILQPGEIERPYGEIPFLHMPERSCLFHDRAQRMRALATGHSMQDYLRFGDLCEAQRGRERLSSVPLPRG